MTSVSRWWNKQGSAARLDLFIRWSLYGLSATEPLLMLAIAHTQAVGAMARAVLVLLSVAHAGSCIALLRAGIARLLGGERPSPWLLGIAAVLTLALFAVGLAYYPAFEPLVRGSSPGRLTVGILACIALTAALTPLFRSPVLLVVLAVGTAVVAAGQAGTGAGGLQSTGAAYSYVLLAGPVAFAYRSSVWMLRLVWEIDRSRAVSARLAVAEERLRFARDLHDVLGRNLSLVAVQSELAAELVRRGQDGAVEQMLQVRQVAQESLREMREVVGGYRTADLDSELAGARSVLRSAGVRVRVIGDGAALPGTVQAALGWVVREATTNVIRHSEATTCTIVLDVVDEPPHGRTTVLRMENDGIRTHGSLPSTAGTGLLGLSERLAGLGGSISSQVRPGGRFVVEARLPISDASTDISHAIPTDLEPAP